MNKGLLFVVSGPSGTGKGTICKVIQNDDNIFLSVSTTSREIRPGEVDGETYNYTSKENFEKMIAEGEMLEWAEYDGNYYGTPKETVKKMLSEGKNIILEIEVQGALKVQQIFPETKMIFVVPPSMSELKKRLVERGREDEERINARLLRAKEELLLSDRYDYIVVNDVLERCIDDVRAIIKKAESEKTLVNNLLKEEY